MPKGAKSQKKKGSGANKPVKDASTKQRIMGMREQLNLKRLEKLVAREADQLTNWVPPPPPPPDRPFRVDEDGIIHYKRKVCCHCPPSLTPVRFQDFPSVISPRLSLTISTATGHCQARSGPEDWQLRGAARPWDSLNDGTLDPNGRPYYIIPDGKDLFATARGGFWTEGGDEARAHIGHRAELALVLASYGRRLEAIEQLCQCLELDTSDGGGGVSSAEGGLSTVLTAAGEDDERACRLSPGLGASGSLAKFLLGYPEFSAEEAPSPRGGADTRPFKKAKVEAIKAAKAKALGGTSIASASSVSPGATSSVVGGSAALRLPHLASTKHSLRSRCLESLRGAAPNSTCAAAAALLVSLAVSNLPPPVSPICKKTKGLAIDQDASAATVQSSSCETVSHDLEVALARNPFILWCLGYPDIFSEAIAAAKSTFGGAVLNGSALPFGVSGQYSGESVTGADGKLASAAKDTAGGGWAAARDALLCASAEAPVWGWIQAALSAHSGGPQGVVRRFLISSPKAAAALEEADAPTAGVPANEFPVAHRFALALSRARKSSTE